MEKFKLVTTAFLKFLCAVFITNIMIQYTVVSVVLLSMVLFSILLSNKGIVSYLERVYVALDILWVVMLNPLFDLLMCRWGTEKYVLFEGNEGKTLSYCLGVNVIVGNTNKVFLIFYKTVDLIFYLFFGEKDHCLNQVKYEY